MFIKSLEIGIWKALSNGQNIIIETVFNDASFKDRVDMARQKDYHTSMIALFLDTPQHSIDRVASRSIEENGLFISGDLVKSN